MKKKLMIIFLFVCVFGVSISAQQTKYIKTNNTKMYMSADARSAVIKNLAQYEAVTVFGKQAKFVNIQTADKKRGWVFEFGLTDSAPPQKSGSKILGGLSSDNYASRDSATRANIRGLTEMSKKYAEENMLSEQTVQTVINMENYTVPINTLERFIENGKLGEFAQ